MKVSRKWLQKHFKEELPDTKALAEALTHHAFEIEEFDDDMLDVKVLPDRACYALSHRGIAYELSAILNRPMHYDQLAEPPPAFASTDALVVTADQDYVLRHTGALMRGVTVGPSPAWLAASLEAVGQRSINNIVDALNCVLLATGQPSGAFDLATFGNDNGVVNIDIRRAKEGETITVLTGETYELTGEDFAFTDAVTGALLDIAGVKGGLSSGVTEKTTDIFLSCGTYDPTRIRRTSQRLKLFTDASNRYQNRVSPELTAYGMRHITDLIREIAGGELVGVVDYYPQPEAGRTVDVSLTEVNGRLGSSFTKAEMEGAFSRLLLPFSEGEGKYVVTPPFYRRDLVIPEDLVEEVGRLLGYDRIDGAPFPEARTGDMRRWRGIERVKDLLVERGFTEISTPSFGASGDILLANPLQTDKPYLRAALSGNMREALSRAALAAPRVEGPSACVRLFEVGTVFTKSGERLSLAMGHKELSGKAHGAYADAVAALGELLGASASVEDGVAEFALGEVDLEKLGEGYAVPTPALTRFRPFSPYPFALRDVAVWTPEGTEESEVGNVILSAAGDLLARMDCFDRFGKDGKVSYAFRLVFESFEKTLSDEELVPLMEKVHAALAGKGFTVR